MLNLDPSDLEKTYRSAVESAELLRRCGETAKAVRVESLARIIVHELQRVSSNGAEQRQPHTR